MEWISVKDRLPDEHACPEDFKYLITDGLEIGTGYYEHEYFSEDPNEAIQYSSACWHDDTGHLKASSSGWATVTHWMQLPNLPPLQTREM